MNSASQRPGMNSVNILPFEKLLHTASGPANKIAKMMKGSEVRHHKTITKIYHFFSLIIFPSTFVNCASNKPNGPIVYLRIHDTLKVSQKITGGRHISVAQFI